MGWREELIAATFRGAGFYVKAHAGTVGRRVQVHEFPLRDKPYTEDLGRKSRDIRLEAYVLGNNYMNARDALLRAVERPGPGQLEHPYLGEMRATCVNCEVREDTAEGGMARFTLEFVEAGDLSFTGEAQSTGAAVVAAADKASDAAEKAFEKHYSVAGRPFFVAQTSREIFEDAMSAMLRAVGAVSDAVYVGTDYVAELNRDVEAQRRDIVTLLYTPASAAQALSSNLQLLVRNVATLPRDALGLARTFFRFGFALPSVLPNTASRRQQAANQAQMLQLVRVVGLAEGARAAAALAFTSYQDALAVRDELTSGMDAVLDGNPDDATFDALRALRSAVVRDISVRGANLARLVQWVPAATLPVLLAAQQLYAEPSRADELLLRNRIRHPLFVPGAQPLEVLSNG